MDTIKQNYPIILTCLIAAGLLLFAYGCPERTSSLIDPAKKVGIEELNCEMDLLLAKYETRISDLEKLKAVKDTVFNHSLSFITSGTINPETLLRDILAIYGIASGSQLVGKKVTAAKKKKAALEAFVA